MYTEVANQQIPTQERNDVYATQYSIFGRAGQALIGNKRNKRLYRLRPEEHPANDPTLLFSLGTGERRWISPGIVTTTVHHWLISSTEGSGMTPFWKRI